MTIREALIKSGRSFSSYDSSRIGDMVAFAASQKLFSFDRKEEVHGEHTISVRDYPESFEKVIMDKIEGWFTRPPAKVVQNIQPSAPVPPVNKPISKNKITKDSVKENSLPTERKKRKRIVRTSYEKVVPRNQQ